MGYLQSDIWKGGRLVVCCGGRDPSVFRLVDLAAEIRVTGDDSQRLRLVFEFLRNAADDVRLLLGVLNLETMQEVIEVVARYFPDEPLGDRSCQLLEDLLAEP